MVDSMGKQGSTKDQILRLISSGTDNLSEISARLDLAPSTVSKHLHDLETSGEIRQKENEHLKKWKYYAVTTQVDYQQDNNKGFTRERRMAIGAVAVFIIASLAVLGYLSFYSGTQKMASVGISITDPPKVPAGTQTLYINYSELSIGSVYEGISNWTSVDAAGRIDLMSLINYSQVIGGVEIRQGSSITAIMFNISSANITIDNATYPVQILKDHLTADVENKVTVDNSTNMLLDFSPVVVSAEEQNSTVFELIPSVQAVIASPNGTAYSRNRSLGPLPVGAKYPLSPGCGGLFANFSKNVSITNSTFEISQNSISLYIQISNDGTTNVTILGVFLSHEQFGNGSGPANNAIGYNYTNGPGSMIAVWQRNRTQPAGGTMPYGGDAGHRIRPYEQSGSNLSINESEIDSMFNSSGSNYTRINLSQPVNNIFIFGHGRANGNLPVVPLGSAPFIQGIGGGLNFIVSTNGTLMLPNPLPYYNAGNGGQPPEPGYVLTGGSSRTFIYSGNFSFGRRAYLTALTNSTYKVAIVTDRGIIEGNITSQ
jgi:DNA-binding transcriptional ArsR family regulator